jgi:hypothetical protein
VTSKLPDVLATVREVLNNDPRFAAFSTFRIWDKRINETSLPAIGVGVPRWTDDEKHTHTSGEVQATMVVALKRSEGDLEILSFEDAAKIKALLLSALEGEDQELKLQEATYLEDTAGERPVSTLSLQFSFIFWPSNL